MNETIENLSSEQALQQQNAYSEIPENSVKERKNATFLDTVTIQAILCVLAAIVFVAVNILDTELAYDVFEIYSEKSTVQENITDTFRMILDFLRSTPVS